MMMHDLKWWLVVRGCENKKLALLAFTREEHSTKVFAKLERTKGVWVPLDVGEVSEVQLCETLHREYDGYVVTIQHFHEFEAVDNPMKLGEVIEYLRRKD